MASAFRQELSNGGAAQPPAMAAASALDTFAVPFTDVSLARLSALKEELLSLGAGEEPLDAAAAGLGGAVPPQMALLSLEVLIHMASRYGRDQMQAMLAEIAVADTTRRSDAGVAGTGLVQPTLNVSNIVPVLLQLRSLAEDVDPIPDDDEEEEEAGGLDIDLGGGGGGGGGGGNQPFYYSGGNGAGSPGGASTRSGRSTRSARSGGATTSSSRAAGGGQGPRPHQQAGLSDEGWDVNVGEVGWDEFARRRRGSFAGMNMNTMGHAVDLARGGMGKHHAKWIQSLSRRASGDGKEYILGRKLPRQPAMRLWTDVL